MNTLFNFKRWRMLAGLQWAENRRSYLLALIAIGGLLLVWFGFIVAMVRENPMPISIQLVTYFIGLYFVGCMFGSQIFSIINRKREAIQYLMVPASHLEKLLCGLIFGVVLFFIAYTLLFYLIDIPMVHLAEKITILTPGKAAWMNYEYGVCNIFSSDQGFIKGMGPFLLVIFFPVQAVFILGSVYFTRLAVLKSILSVLLLFLLGQVLAFKLIADHLPYRWQMQGLFRWVYREPAGDVAFVSLPSSIEAALSLLAVFGLPVIFWVITYFRLKEKEV